MEKKNPGNNEMPDFKELNDRIIEESPSTPMLVIKTNLDPKSVGEDNPYYQEKNSKEFEDFFEGK